MNISLHKKIAIIGGSTQGIGLAIAHELAGNGATCLLLARNGEVLKEIINQLPTPTSQHHEYYIADFSDTTQVKLAMEKIIASHAVHILVNNTGGPKPGPIADATEEEFLSAFRQHLINNQLLSKAVVPSMKNAGYGRIINIISTSVRIPINNLGVSNTIRAAVASWAKTLSNELGQFNITVNNVLPGFTDTQRLNSLITSIAQQRGVANDIIEKEMMETIPAKRFGNASEIASVVAFLASPAASYINGVSIPVDGGKTGTI
ncbi:MAG: SDR family oxidoreductase [Chitinophagaceae bacterium]